jgi:uncharacterized protein (DUF2062 family)
VEKSDVPAAATPDPVVAAPEANAEVKPRGYRARAKALLQHEKVKAAWARLRGGELTPFRAAASVFVGVLVGTTPLYGLHFLLVMGICLPLRLDVAIAYVASNVSLPIFAPFINTAEVEIGAWLRTGKFIHFDRADFEARGPFDYARELVLGTLIFSPVAAFFASVMAYGVAWTARRRKLSEKAV